MVKTGIYIRVSTEEQAKEGFSINAQKEKLKQYSFSRDWDIYDYYIDDGISGKNLKDRPNILRLLEDVKSSNINNILVYKIDRITRSTKNLIELIELFNDYNCSFNSIMESIDTSSATGRMFIKIVGIFAEFERENLAERVTLGYEQKTREGNYTNTNGVYGYDYVVGIGNLLVNEYEKNIVNDIYNYYLEGQSLSKISKLLIDKKVPTKRGGKWCQSTISSILSNPLYIGKVRYNVENYKNCDFEADSNHEPIISKETFRNVQEIMKKRQRFKSRRYPSENTYFLGTLICSECGSRLISKQHRDNKTKHNKLYASYLCQNKRNGNCNCIGFSHKKMEQAFLNYIKDYPTMIPEINKMNINNNSNDEKRKVLEIELGKLDKKVNEIRNLFLQEKLTFEEYKNFSTKLDENILSINEEMNEIMSNEDNIDIDQIKDIIGNIELNFRYLDNKEKLTFINSFIHHIKVKSDNGKVFISDIKFNNL